MSNKRYRVPRNSVYMHDFIKEERERWALILLILAYGVKRRDLQNLYMRQLVQDGFAILKFTSVEKSDEFYFTYRQCFSGSFRDNCVVKRRVLRPKV